MAELSGFWTTTGTATGDQQASYTQAHWSTACRILGACCGFEGVASGYLNELACTVTGANTVAVNTGGGLVDGKWFINDASQNVNIPSASGAGNTRIDRIVLRATWAQFNVSVYRIAGVDAASPTAPAITQTSGTTYDIQLYQALVNTSGTVTLTDERTWAAVGTDAIGTGAVTGAKIANDAVDSQHYADGSIDTAHIADEQVTAAKIANRTRTFIVPASGMSDKATVDDVTGVQMPDAQTQYGYGQFKVPNDFVSGLTVKAVVRTDTTGNMYTQSYCYYGADGEAYNTHSATFAAAAVAVVANQRNVISSMSLSSAATGDFVSIYTYRNGAHASDTVNGGTVYLSGWEVSYTADS